MAEEYAPGSFNLGYDSISGTLTKMHITTDQKLVFEDIVNIDQIAAQNKADRDAISNTAKLPDGMVRVASLPMMVYFDLKKRGILEDKTALRRWLKSEEAIPFRTHRITS